jgi:hypothetical protein
MALYIKFHNKRYDENIDLTRSQSAIKFFDTLSKRLTFIDLKYKLYMGDALDDTFEVKDYVLGILEKDIRNEIKRDIGVVVLGKLKISEEAIFKFSFDLRTRGLCFNKEHFDIRLEILPNKYAEVFEDIKVIKPDLMKIIVDRVKIYNDIIIKKDEDFQIKRAVCSKHGDEYNEIADWSFFYSQDPLSFYQST